MKRSTILFLLTLLVVIGQPRFATILPGLAVAHESSTAHTEQTNDGAPLFNNLGNYHHPISTHSELAQRYFDQGLILAYGFNHAEAARSFREAAKLDPNCAMCYWGVALVLGPNINAPMEAGAVPEAWTALQEAIALSKNAPEQERAYIQALAVRYTLEPTEDRSALDAAYAITMRKVQARYPNDPDAATLFAEALMDTMPWNYWQENGELKPEAREILTTLESILKQNPNHPGANHLYIHAVEKERPALGIAAADRLMDLVPGAGHLVHMASHIYIRVGRYHDAVVSNQRAIAADDAYVTQCHAQGMYPLAYMPHNHHFLWFGALMTGQSEVALQAARHTAEVDETLMREPGLAGALQHYSTIPLYTLTRFEQWDEILATPAPDADLKYPRGVWHYARGTALMATGQLQQAAQELEALRAIATDPALQELKIWGFNSTASVLNIATEVLAGNLAAKQGDYEQAIARLGMAVGAEDALVYTEPANWYHPARQSLGAVLLAAGKAKEAEQVYRDDLKIYPDNGWSLRGLARSLDAQGKKTESQAVQARFEQAWRYADVAPTTLRF